MLQLEFKKLTLHNFASYADSTFDLGMKGFCLVTGENHCPSDNAASNGSGKSFVFSGVCYALTGETINGQTKDLKNINVDSNEMWVELEFAADGHEYVIRRGTAPAKTLSISKDGADISGHTYTATAEKLEEELPELTKDLLASTIIIGQGMPNKFSSFSPSGRKELLEKLTKSDYMIEDIKNRVIGRRGALEANDKSISDALLVAATKLQKATSDLAAAKCAMDSRTKPDFDGEIAASEAAIAECQKQQALAKARVDECTAEMNEANKQVIASNEGKSQKTAQLNESYHAKVDGIYQKLTQTTAEETSKNAELRRLRSIKDVCPTCGQKLVGVEKPDTTALEAEIKSLGEEKAKLQAELAEADGKKKQKLADIDEAYRLSVADSETKMNNCSREIASCNKAINSLTANAASEQRKLSAAIAKRDSWDAETKRLEDQIGKLTSEISALDAEVASRNAAKSDCQDRIAVVKKLETLTKRDFRGFLLENIIAYVDQKAKDFCEVVFGTRRLKVCIDGNNLDITYCDKVFDGLSGGEKQRVDLILQLVIRDLLQNYLGFHSNILVLDEITDFLDAQSCGSVMTLLERELINIESVFVISHHASELGLPIDSEMRIIKDENGISALAA